MDSLALTLRSTISYTETAARLNQLAHHLTETVTPTPSSSTTANRNTWPCEGHRLDGDGFLNLAIKDPSWPGWMPAPAHIESHLTRSRAYLSAAHYPRRNSITGAVVDSIFASTCTRSALVSYLGPNYTFFCLLVSLRLLFCLTGYQASRMSMDLLELNQRYVYVLSMYFLIV